MVLLAVFGILRMDSVWVEPSLYDRLLLGDRNIRRKGFAVVEAEGDFARIALGDLGPRKMNGPDLGRGSHDAHNEPSLECRHRCRDELTRRPVHTRTDHGPTSLSTQRTSLAEFRFKNASDARIALRRIGVILFGPVSADPNKSRCFGTHLVAN